MNMICAGFRLFSFKLTEDIQWHWNTFCTKWLKQRKQNLIFIIPQFYAKVSDYRAVGLSSHRTINTNLPGPFRHTKPRLLISSEAVQNPRGDSVKWLELNKSARIVFFHDSGFMIIEFHPMFMISFPLHAYMILGRSMLFRTGTCMFLI